MKKSRKFTALISMLLAGSMLFTACSPAGALGSGTPASSGSASGTSVKPDGYFKKYDPPITLTTHAVVTADTMYQDGGTAEDNEWTKWQLEHLGIQWKLKWTATSGDNDAQKLDLAFASDDLPDVISPSTAQLSKYAAAGKIQPLDDLVGSYASPLVKWALQDGEDQTKGTFFLPFTQNGKKYGMPVMSETMNYWYINFIRSDILKDLGMDVPQTLDDLEKVFAAYHAKYPNATALGLDNDLNGIVTATAPFQAYPFHWVQKDDGKLAYGSSQPEMRNALEEMDKWYQEGYINPEFVVKDGSKLSEDITQGNVLTWNGHWSNIANPSCGLWDNVKGSSVTAMPYVTGEDGKTGYMTQNWFSGCRAITTSCKNPEALFYLLNENWDSYYRNNKDLRSLMKEKYDYEFKYPVTEEQTAYNIDEVAKDYPNAGVPRQLWKYKYPEDLEGCGYMNSFYTHYLSLFGLTGSPVSIANEDLASMAKATEKKDTSVLTSDGRRMYDEWNSTNPKMLTTFSDIYDYWNKFEKSDSFHADAFAGAPTATMSEKWSYLSKLEKETFTKIIMGSEPITAFDDFVKNWNANGGEQITKEVNEWHDSL